jgi:hypothetical protein
MNKPELFSISPDQPRRRANLAGVIALILVGLAGIALTSGRALGQAASAVIEGTVLDASGAAVPDADIVVANPALGLERRAKTSGAGVFTVPDLTPAPGYTVTITKGQSVRARSRPGAEPECSFSRRRNRRGGQRDQRGPHRRGDQDGRFQRREQQRY